MNTFDGYIRRDGTNSKVLLDGGDVKALSSFIGTISYTNNKITYTKADGTSYDLVDLSNYIYNLGAATSDNLGGIKIGFSQSGKNYPVQLDSNNKAYVYVPWEENSHYTTRLYVGDGTAENKITTNGNTRITVTDDNNVRNYITLIGSGATNISSDDNGKITINSTNTTYNIGDSATLNKGTNTEGKLWSAKTLVDYISDILGIDSTAITSLNTLIGQLHDNDTATGILVELAKKLNTPSSSIGSNNQPIYWNGSSFTTIGYTIEKSVPSSAVFTDTKYSFYVGENNNIKEHKNVSNPYFKLFENNTPTSIQIKAGSGISIASDANGNITITNSSPDQNHNTDKTGIKLGTISGTKKTDSTVIINNSSTGLTIAGGTNKFSIGDGINYIEIPITPSFTVSNKDATIGTSLTTIATIAGTDIKAKIGSYLPLSGGTITGHLTIKTSSYKDQLTIYRNESNNNSVINFSNKDGFLGAIGFTGIGQIGMAEKPHVVLKDGTLYTLLHSGNTSISNGVITINGTSITPLTSIGSYIPLSGNTTSTPITGTLYFKDVSGLVLNSKDLDIDIWKVYGNSGAWKAQYGFHLRYLGIGSYNNNDLVLYAHNQQSTHKEVYRVHQDGTFIFGATPYVGANTIVHSGNVNQYAITSLSNYPTKSETVLDAGAEVQNTIYSLGTKRVFSGQNLTDAPVQGWVSGLVLGSNWNNNHYQHYLVEANDRWYTTRDYENSKMKSWKTFAYLSDIPTKVSQLTNDSGYLTSHQSLPDMIKRHPTSNQFNDTAGLRVIVVNDDSTLLESRKWGSIIQWSNANYSPSTVNSINWYNQLMGLTDDRLYFRTRTNGGNWTNFHKVAWTSDIPTKSSWNYDDRYLKLSGGSLSGYLTISGGSSHVPLIVKGGLTGYRHNIQLIPSDNWSGILFGANDVTTESGTTTNSYWVGNNNGAFSITKGGSGNASVSLYCNGTDWYVNTKKIALTSDLSNYLTITTNQTVSGVKTFNNGCWSIAASENNEITTEHFGRDKYYNNANTAVVSNLWSITNALKFRWYSDYWLIGNIRSGGYNTAGFGIALRDNTNNRQIDCFRVTKEVSYIKGYVVLHKGNSSVSKSGETLTVNIGGTSYSLTNTNTWRGITDSYLGTDSTISLSQKGGNDLYNTLLNGYASSAGNADTVDNEHASAFVHITGSTMSGNLLVANSEPSIGVKQEGYGDILLISGMSSKNRGLYNSDAGLGWLCGWDANNNAFFNGNASTASNATNATYANYLNIVADNEIRFNNKPSSPIDVYFNYLWAGGIADDKINTYRFMNGNRGYAGIVAEQLSCTNGYIYLYGPGSGIYNLSSIFSNSYGLTIETPRATNAQNGTALPLMVKTRGGQWSELQTGTIVANGNVTATAFYASSDLRLKNILTQPNYSAEQLASLPLVKYTWKDKENDSVHLGSIAQNVEEDFAELVNTDNEGYKSLDYATLGAIGVISLAREIVELKKEIKELKSKLYG